MLCALSVRFMFKGGPNYFWPSSGHVVAVVDRCIILNTGVLCAFVFPYLMADENEG